MPPYLPIRALNRSQRLRFGKGSSSVVPTTTTTAYLDTGDANQYRDFQRHSALGSVYVVGPLTASKVDPVVLDGAVTTPGTGDAVDVSAGTLWNRQTTSYVDVVPAVDAALTLTTTSGKSQVFQVVVDNTTGVVTVVAGTPATTGTQVAPATAAGQTALANVTLAHGATSVIDANIVDVRPRP